MKDNPFTIQEQVVIVRRYKDISITSKLQAFHLPTAKLYFPAIIMAALPGNIKT